jgi:predicted Zn finger-like uncharacterized protein
MDVRCDRCQTEYELDDDIVTDAGASVQCTTCGHTFFVRRQGRVTAASPGGVGRRTAEAAESGLGGSGGRSEEPAPASPEWTLDTEDGKVHRFRELNTLQKWIVERRVTREDRVSHAGGPFRLLGELPELVPFFNVVEEADRARLQGGGAAGGERPPSRAAADPARNHAGGGATSAGRSSAEAGMEPTISFSVPVAEAFRRASEDGPTVPDRRLFDPGTVTNGLGAEISADVTAISAPPPGVALAAPAPAPREVSGAGPMPPPVPADASRPHPRGPSSGGPAARSSTPRPGTLAPTQAPPGSSSRTVPGGGTRRAAVTQSVAFPNDALAGASDLELLRPSRGRGLIWTVLVLALAGAGGGYLWYRSAGGVRPGSPVSPAGGEAVPPAPSSGTSAESAGVRGPGSAAASSPAVAASEGERPRARETATVVPSSVPNPGSNVGSSGGPTPTPTTGREAQASAPLVAATGNPVDAPRGAAAAGSGRPQARVAPPGPTEAAVVDADRDHAAANPADRASPGAAPAGDARPPSYERLVVEGNRLRVHGNMARASKLYEQALAMRPDGVMALTGTGYVQLEHQRHFKAIDFFRRALAIDPTHGPALFGIAEAYRARGDTPEALAAYRQYLALAPSGDDVGEARRQIKALSSDDEGN